MTMTLFPNDRRDYQQLRIAESEVEDILLLLILDQKIEGKLDQPRGILNLHSTYVSIFSHHPGMTKCFLTSSSH